MGGAFISQSENFWGTGSSTKEYKYVVLGGGNASGYAAEEFLKKGIGKNELCIISEEPYVSYERPALSKAYLSPEKPARLPGFHTCVGGGGERQTAEWYKEKGIEFMTSTPVTGADVKSKTLTTAKGEKIKYGKLIVATGARPMTLADFKVPGSNLDGLFYLRNVEDADSMYAKLQEARKSGKKKCLVVGGGYIGMECAAKLLDNSCDVTVVFPESRLMERLFTAEMAKYYEDIFKAKGTKFIKGDGCLVTHVHGDKAATGVTLKNGAKLDADIIVVGTGARPNTELFTDQLQMAAVNPKVGQIGGIQVNEYMQTSDRDVYAVGDVAAFPLRRYGNRVTRQEHVTHCRSSARQAVDHIMDPASVKPYDYLPFFYSRIFDLSWKYWGSADGEPVFFKDGKKIGSVWVDSAGTVTGAFLESGSPDEEATMKKLVDEGLKVKPSDVKSKGMAALK